MGYCHKHKTVMDGRKRYTCTITRGFGHCSECPDFERGDPYASNNPRAEATASPRGIKDTG